MNNTKVTFYDIEQSYDLVGYTNIVCNYQGKFLLVRGKGKTTWELPGGHIEKGEKSLDAAKRELYEETGITGVDLIFLCSRKLEMFEKGATYYGNVYVTNILELGKLPEFEIEEVKLFEKIPKNLTYPFIQIDILNKAKEFIYKNKMF